MAEPTLPSVFGLSATQSSTLLTLVKADFSTLTASATNTAEALLVALILQWKSTLTPAAQATNADQSIRIEQGAESIVTDFNTSTKYIEIPFTLTLRKPYTSIAIDPDDY